MSPARRRSLPALALLAAALLPAPAGAGVVLEPGFFYGIRKVNDAKIRSVYGEGGIYCPYLQARLGRWLVVGASYEGGYARDGLIGLYLDAAHLTVTGADLYAGAEWRTGAFAFYGRAGLGLFSYKQTIIDPYVQDIRVGQTRLTLTAGAGIKVYPVKQIFFALEARYVPLKVQPYEYPVDLGGLRLLGGLGLSFGL